MFQKYEKLEMEVIAFDVEDVITTSGEPNPGDVIIGEEHDD